LSLGQAVDSVKNHAKTQRLTGDQDRMWLAMGLASKVQFVGMILLFFSQRALDWWRWLPV
jgi:hypothetical protein